jgi:hypothetical protein
VAADEGTRILNERSMMREQDKDAEADGYQEAYGTYVEPDLTVSQSQIFYPKEPSTQSTIIANDDDEIQLTMRSNLSDTSNSDADSLLSFNYRYHSNKKRKV